MLKHVIPHFMPLHVIAMCDKLRGLLLYGRKLQKAIIKEGRRRSPRITAMEAWQTHGPGSGSGSAGDPVAHSESKGKNASNCTDKTRSHLDNDQGPAFRTRGRKKRKLRPVEELTASSSVLSPPKQVFVLALIKIRIISLSCIYFALF